MKCKILLEEYRQMQDREEKVYFSGNFGHHIGDGRAGIKISLEEQFDFAGREWRIPAMYKCKKGIIVDFCVKISKEDPFKF